jgi:outer membrane protein assembly factor BamB
MQLVVVRAGADDWPQWRGPDRNGISRETGWLVKWPPVEAWRQSIGLGYSSVSVSGTRLYTMGYSNGMDWVYCFNALTGTQIWTRSYASTLGGTYPGTRATPTVCGSELYTFNIAGELRCFDTVTGSNLWTQAVNYGNPIWYFSSSPLVEGNLVIVNAGGAGVAVDRFTHGVVWSNITGNAGYSSPFAVSWNSERIVPMLVETRFVGVVATNGRIAWSFPWTTSAGANCADPIIYSNKIFISSGYTAGCALLSPGTGGVLKADWQNTNLQNHYSSSVLVGDYLYGFSGQVNDNNDLVKHLVCLDVRDGSIKWSRNDLGLGAGTLMAAEGKLIVLGQHGDLVVISALPSGYDAEGRSAVHVCDDATWWTAPVLANGRIYCRSDEGTLVCLKVCGFVDANRNGIEDSWEEKYCGGTNACIADADSDGDGLINRAEYIAGTDPTNARSCFVVRSVFSNRNVLVTFPALSATGIGYEGMTRHYRIESARNIFSANWLPVPNYTNIVGTDSNITFVETNPLLGKQYYRLKAWLQ